MCSCTTEQVFAWVGAILVNAGFISVIVWGAITEWYIGFTICAVYTILLFVVARVVDKKSAWDAVAPVDVDVEVPPHDDDTEHVDQPETDDGVVTAVEANVNPQNQDQTLPRTTSITERRLPVMANFLYGLFTLAFGVTGFFLPMNVIPCDYYYSTPSGGEWTTADSSLPNEVREWIASSESPENVQYGPATFIYIEETKVTMFQGSDGSDYQQTLWSTTNGSEVINFSEIQNPSYFVDTESNGRACFRAYINILVIGCSDGNEVTTTDSSEYTLQGPYDLFVDNNHTLWFKDYPPWYGEQSGSGTLVYSISNYSIMNVELHSTFSTSKDVPQEEQPMSDDSACLTNQLILAIFVSALPTTISSIILWIKRTAPATAITSYVGISAVAVFIYLAIIGKTLFDFNSFWGWWLSVSGALYIISLCDLFHCKRYIARIPLVWGINFGSIAFFGGIIIVTGIYDERTAWSWVVFNIFAIIPLGVIGLGYNQIFLQVLCAVGWLMTSIKIASALVAAFSVATVPIYFIVLALSGMLIASVGWFLNKYQERIQHVIFYRMEKLSLSKRLFPEVESMEEPN